MPERRVRRRAVARTRAAALLCLTGSLVGASLAVPSAALARPVARPRAAVTAARLNAYHQRLTVAGWAYDAASPARSITVEVRIRGRVLGTVRAAGASTGLDARRHITGRHAFRMTVRWTRDARRVAVAAPARRAGRGRVLGRRAVRQAALSPGQRAVVIARRYVGKARYVSGGESPKQGFDCSGYTKYVYARAHIHRLPHSAEGQRRMRGMRRVGVAHARPGDLVFYMSGGSAYHVAIYAGHHRQYAAATPRDGIRFQKVWSRDVQ